MRVEAKFCLEIPPFAVAMVSVVVPCVKPCTARRRRTCACAAAANAGSASLMALGAAARQRESLRADKLLDDPYAQHLVSPGDELADSDDDSHVVAARAFDAAILNATQRGVRQVVALGHGGDTRGYRLGWPPGVRCFELAPFDAVAHAELAFTRAGVKPAKGTLVRRVAADVSGPGARGAGWTERLQQAGFSANLHSVWALQGLHLLPEDALAALVVEVGDCVALNSELVGEVGIDAMQRHFGALLADAGFHLEQWATLQEVGAELSRTLGPDAAQRAIFRAAKVRVTGIEHDMLRAEMDRAEYENGEEGFNDMP